MNIDTVIERTKRFEGTVDHMYLDTRGNVTVGTGHLLPNEASALHLPFVIAGGPASLMQITVDYRAVVNARPGKPAGWYAMWTKCVLPSLATTGLLVRDVNLFAGQLAHALPRWTAYPEAAQQAIFDMAYNLGANGLERYPHMLAACDAGDWARAAKESHRNGIGDERNVEIAALFQACAEVQAAG